jgi:hypothetical protein
MKHAAGWCLGALLTCGPALAQVPSLGTAMIDYRTGNWSAAYGQLLTLANNGNPEAARLALHMWRHGPELYASRWDATEDEVDLWARLSGEKPRQAPHREGPAARSTGEQARPASQPRSQTFQGWRHQRGG